MSFLALLATEAMQTQLFNGPFNTAKHVMYTMIVPNEDQLQVKLPHPPNEGLGKTQDFPKWGTRFFLSNSFDTSSSSVTISRSQRLKCPFTCVVSHAFGLRTASSVRGKSTMPWVYSSMPSSKARYEQSFILNGRSCWTSPIVLEAEAKNAAGSNISVGEMLVPNHAHLDQY